VAPGEYSIRGGIVDLFPMGSQLPYRLDLFDDEIESIKTFDVDSQRTLYPVPEVRLLPAREFPLDEKGRARFRQRFREIFEGDPGKSRIYKDVSNGVAAAGIEYWLPLFFDGTATSLRPAITGGYPTRQLPGAPDGQRWTKELIRQRNSFANSSRTRSPGRTCACPSLASQPTKAPRERSR